MADLYKIQTPGKYHGLFGDEVCIELKLQTVLSWRIYVNVDFMINSKTAITQPFLSIIMSIFYCYCWTSIIIYVFLALFSL